MPVSPSSAAQAARENVARRLRALRREAGFTGAQLARECGWHHSKTSRIENARTPPSPTDIRLWCRACGAAGDARVLIEASQEAESLYMEWRRRVRTGMRQLQESYTDLFRSTRLFRVYSPTVVPGLVQTVDYAQAVLKANGRLLEAPDDYAQAAEARAERSQMLFTGGRRCVLVIEEAVLRYQLGGVDVMVGQLGHLLSVGSHPAVSLGVVPLSLGPRRQWPQEIFHVYDDALVAVELLAAQVSITQPDEVALYLRAFEELRGMAVYGAEARSLIARALTALE